ncbi:dTDP-glucose 4,6-dehydratase [Sphingomonas psychrolutea]|uniref:dTDP-glucose 4,6-dehydratase n=1 Tax=Sphingomonas psychrolutea TaxID=1259676 RepID=A0ABQ1FZ00_9SPHN|nr:dTDP-glucose 4,6-dehydratase [Sphingomonas psychrolutea]GGA34231.1 dTDP-glucose 4,6-dehydratase [Sphingomonas psychrolutea]
MSAVVSLGAAEPERCVLVTGGAGFIGSAVCRHLVRGGTRVINLDKLTYAGSLSALAEIAGSPHYRFVQGDIADRALVARLLAEERVDAVMHLAAESHVDRSIAGPAVFIETNITGTFHLLEVALDHWRSLDGAAKERFRFHHISTDEVFGDLPFDSSRFDEQSPYCPSSPYSASKAASDHLVRAWQHTFGLPVVLSNCSNNYGPHQFPEKLIPLTITRAAAGLSLPVYGTGENVRDWLHVEDHARALEAVMTRGAVGETYVIGGRAEHSNIAVVAMICDLLDARAALANGKRRRSLIRFVTDRPGHDRRYAIDPTRVERDLGWRAEIGFAAGLAGTIDWYLADRAAQPMAIPLVSVEHMPASAGGALLS